MTSSEITIQPAQKDALPLILELQKKAFWEEAEFINDFTIGPLVQTLDDLIREFETFTFLQATDETGRIIGSVRGEKVEDVTFISKLVVDPNCQGKGLGQKLLTAIETELPSNTYKIHTRDQNIKALNLYLKNNYKIYKEEDLKPHFRFSYMQKIL
ncbi:MAG: GNAT family N-acetyltransferase [Deltaproteobacteria bacterium]|jgi:ribosomal protein S18 acetylase RimI-like enzyme|nr:GNAT family N-acetyltransferase [Deltaproteobacteria bacterium]